MTKRFLPLLPLLCHLNVSALSTASASPLPTAAGVATAYNRFAALQDCPVVTTPLLESPLLNQQLECRLLVKAECLQYTGSFKFRGAFNRLLTLLNDSPDAAAKGVIAFSSGNFGQALAAAATSLKIPCSIVSPHDAPSVKLNRIQQYGANLVISKAKAGENREVVASTLAQELAETKGLTLLHPFEDANVVHGQGTCGMEVMDQCQVLIGDSPDYILVPCGGGGLTAGINLAVEQKQTTTQVYTIEPRGFDDHAQSFQRGQRLSLAELYPNSSDNNNYPDRSVFCDALMAGAPGITTWEINQPRLAGALESSGDASAANAMKIAFDYYRLVLEPSGALGLAAILDGQLPPEKIKNKTVVVIASGGNIDLDIFAKLMGCTNDSNT